MKVYSKSTYVIHIEKIDLVASCSIIGKPPVGASRVHADEQ